jgi:hypothetical protein
MSRWHRIFQQFRSFAIYSTGLVSKKALEAESIRRILVVSHWKCIFFSSITTHPALLPEVSPSI